MKTIIKKGVYEILKEFYDNHNRKFYLRELSRKTKLNENSISRFLNYLLENKILAFEKDGNLKKFFIKSNYLPMIFSIYDEQKLNSLPLLRKTAILDYILGLSVKPIIAVVFGSTAKGNFGKGSDIDVLLIVNRKIENGKLVETIKSQTGIKIQEFQIKEKDFLNELKNKKEKLVQSAIESGFPVFNNKYYYEAIYNG